MESFFYHLQQRYCLSDLAIKELVILFKPVTVKKKEIFVQPGLNERYVFFVCTGLTRAFLTREEKNYTAFFSFENEMLDASPISTGKTTQSISCEAVEDSLLYRAPKLALENLFQTSLELSNWNRKLLEERIAYFNNYFLNYFYEEKSVQYKKFLEEYPQLIQRVALKDLATYLNVTPQSLSRIRAEI